MWRHLLATTHDTDMCDLTETAYHFSDNLSHRKGKTAKSSHKVFY